MTTPLTARTQPLTHNQPQDVRALGAKRKTNSQLVLTLRHRIGQHAVNADQRQPQCRQREEAEQHHDESRLRARTVHQILGG